MAKPLTAIRIDCCRPGELCTHIVEAVNGTALNNTVRVIAEMNHNQISTAEREVTLDSYPAAEALSALETLYLPQVTKDEFLTIAERERLLKQDIGAMVIVPLVANQRLTGLIVFIHPTPQAQAKINCTNDFKRRKH